MKLFSCKNICLTKYTTKRSNMQYLVSSLQTYTLHRRSVLKPPLAAKQNNQTSVRTSWSSVSLSLFGTGFFLGPLLDGLHSRVNLVVYKSGSIHIGPLHTNIWVGFNFNFFYTFNAPLVPTILPLFVRFLPCWGCFTALLVCFNST